MSLCRHQLFHLDCFPQFGGFFRGEDDLDGVRAVIEGGIDRLTMTNAVVEAFEIAAQIVSLREGERLMHFRKAIFPLLNAT